MANRTRFEQRLHLLADDLVVIREMEASPKLSAAAFLRESMKAAQADAKRIDEIARLLEQPHCAEARSFVNTIAKAIREPTIKCMPKDFGKVMRAWGSETALSEAAMIKTTVPELWAVAVRVVAAKWPDAFGTVDDWAAHQTAVADAKHKLDAHLERLRTMYTPADVDITTVGLTSAERNRGLVKLVFRCAPEVSLANPNWPRELVESVLRRREAPPPEAKPAPKPKRVRVPRDAIVAMAQAVAEEIGV